MSDPLLGRLREFGADGLILSGDPREGALIGDQRAAQRIPGRGVLVRRRQDPAVIQAVLDEETQRAEPLEPHPADPAAVES
jgi:S-DNA-T family DNA segregation ATPase FtsK/SpoIIIE